MVENTFRILLAEDDPLLQHVFHQQMKKLGFTVSHFAPNGLDAVQKAVSEKFDIVFMDVRMPLLDGLSATQRIRKEESEKGVYTPIVGLTAFAHRGKCLKVGMDDFLQKPVVLSELKEILTKWSDQETIQKVTGGISGRESISTEKFDKQYTEVSPEDFNAISERLESIKSKIEKLRGKYNI